MSNKWITALKEFNKDKNEWCIPKKGTDGYKETKAMMEKKDKKKEAGSFLSNILKSRLQEEKMLKTLTDDYGYLQRYKNEVEDLIKPRADKKKREDIYNKINTEYKAKFGKDLNKDIKSEEYKKKLRDYNDRVYEKTVRNQNEYYNKYIMPEKPETLKQTRNRIKGSKYNYEYLNKKKQHKWD